MKTNIMNAITEVVTFEGTLENLHESLLVLLPTEEYKEFTANKAEYMTFAEGL